MNTPRRGALIAATALLAVIVLCLCLIPKPEDDLFFELRIGADILRLGHVPHTDTYSWVRRGTHWDVPEWLSFVLFALAFRVGGFFGTWALMATLAVAAAMVVWFRLAGRLGLAWAFPLTNLMLLAMSLSIQERPYAFTYLLLALGLVILLRGRRGPARALWRLVPLCALWANLHQGVVAFLGLLLAYAVGDGLTAAWLRAQGRGAGGALRRAGRMAGTAALCAVAAMLSPYGWRLYWNVFITLRDRALMSNIIEWRPIASLPFAETQPFLLVAVFVFGALALSRRRSLPDALAALGLFIEALLHVRNIPLFALGGLVIAAPHLQSALRGLRRRLGLPPRPRAAAGRLLAAFAVFYALTVGLVGFAGLRRWGVGPQKYSLAEIGGAAAEVPRFPEAACRFIEAERFPPRLRLYNDLGIGGYLIWRLPDEPVFVDGRLDVYAGRTFDRMLTLVHDCGSPAWAALVRRYDFDCVITTSGREARAFAASPQWQLVYRDPPVPYHLRCRVLLRRRRRFAALIARCLRARPEGDRP